MPILFRVPGRGGVTRGRGDANLTFGPEGERDSEFAVEALPAARFGEPQSENAGIVIGSPTVEPSAEAPAQGDVAPDAGAPMAGRRIAPRHRSALQSFFGRPQPAAGTEKKKQ